MTHSFLLPNVILRYVPIAEGMNVGECGVSGSGAMMAALSEAVGPEGSVLAFDVNKNVLSALASEARLQGVTNVLPVWTDLEVVGGTIAVRDHQLDLAIAVHLFHESVHHRELLAELRRMLKRGAHLAIVDWTKESTHPLAPKVATRLAAGYCTQLATENGYTVASSFAPDEDHWGVLLTTT
jgi:ubiquinone/menaquinone biosynthesis C-methylase UbiE